MKKLLLSFLLTCLFTNFPILKGDALFDLEKDLRLFVFQGNLKEIEKHLRNIPDIKKELLQGPIIEAIHQKNNNILEFLLEKSHELEGYWDNHLFNPICFAISENNKGLVDLFLEYGLFENAKLANAYDPECERQTGKEWLSFYMVESAMYNIEMLKFILNKKSLTIHPYHLNSLLVQASTCENPEFAECIIKQGVDVISEAGSEALMKAIKKGHLKTAQLLLNYDAPINGKESYSQKTALHIAVEQKNIDAVKFLLEHGADPNLQDNQGSTPLHYAVYFTDIALVRYLVEHGADLNIKTDNEYPPAHCAIEYGSIPILEYLLSKNGSLDCSHFNNKITSLHIAVLSQNIDMVTYILKFNQDIDTQDENGKTALHYALHTNLFDIVNLLVRNGASINIQDSEGKTPHDYLQEIYENEKAILSNDERCKECLRESIQRNMEDPLYKTGLKEAYDLYNDVPIPITSNFASLGKKSYTLGELYDDPSILWKEN